MLQKILHLKYLDFIFMVNMFWNCSHVRKKKSAFWDLNKYSKLNAFPVGIFYGWIE